MEKVKRQVLQLSFKTEEKEQELYEFLRSKLSPTAFIKELLWDVYNQKPIVIQTIQPQDGSDNEKDCFGKVDNHIEREEVVWY